MNKDKEREDWYRLAIEYRNATSSNAEYWARELATANQTILEQQAVIEKIEGLRIAMGHQPIDDYKCVLAQHDEEIRQQERERCAVVCDQIYEAHGKYDGASAGLCSDLIRALK